MSANASKSLTSLDLLTVKFATNILGVIGASTILLLPGLVGLIAETLALDPSQVGWIASADLTAMGVSMTVMAFFVHRLNWRKLAVLSLVVLALGYGGSIAADNFVTMLGARFLSGIGEGIAVSVAFVILGGMRDPDRQFGIYLICALTFGACGLLVLPVVASTGGQNLIFGLLLLLVALSLAAVAWLPAKHDETVLADTTQVHLPRLLLVLGLGTVFCYFLAQGNVWAYLERMGSALEFPPETIGRGLATSSMAGVFGALAATIISTRFGRAWPLSISAAISCYALSLLWSNVSSTHFIVAASLFNFGWNLSQPLFSGLMSELDVRGRAVCLMGGVQTIAVGFGPAVAAVFITARSYAPVIVIGITAIVTSQLLVLTLIGLSKQRQAAELQLPDAPA